MSQNICSESTEVFNNADAESALCHSTVAAEVARCDVKPVEVEACPDLLSTADKLFFLDPSEDFAGKPIFTPPGMAFPKNGGDEVAVLKRHLLENGQTAPILLDRVTGQVCGRAAMLQAMHELKMKDIQFKEVANPFIARLSDFNSGRLSVIEMSDFVVALADGKVSEFKPAQEGKMSEKISEWLTEYLHNGVGGFSARQVEDYLFIGRATDVERESVNGCKVVSKAVGMIKKQRFETTPKAKVSDGNDVKANVRKLTKIVELGGNLAHIGAILKDDEISAFNANMKILNDALKRLNGTADTLKAA